MFHSSSFRFNLRSFWDFRIYLQQEGPKTFFFYTTSDWQSLRKALLVTFLFSLNFVEKINEGIVYFWDMKLIMFYQLQLQTQERSQVCFQNVVLLPQFFSEGLLLWCLTFQKHSFQILKKTVSSSVNLTLSYMQPKYFRKQEIQNTWPLCSLEFPFLVTIIIKIKLLLILNRLQKCTETTLELMLTISVACFII